MRTRVQNLVLPLLLATFLLQVSYRQWWYTPPLTGPSTDERLPVQPVVWLNGSTGRLFALPSDRCMLLMFMRPNCPICQRMRITFPSQLARWQDSLRKPIQVVWLTDHPIASMSEFVKGFPLEKIDVAMLEKADTVSATKLGIYGTPTTYLIDADHRLRVGMIGDGLPPSSMANKFCE